MFGYLKDKLKKAVKKFSKEAEETVVEETVEDAQAIQRAKEPAPDRTKKTRPKAKEANEPAQAAKGATSEKTPSRKPSARVELPKTGTSQEKKKTKKTRPEPKEAEPAGKERAQEPTKKKETLFSQVFRKKQASPPAEQAPDTVVRAKEKGEKPAEVPAEAERRTSPDEIASGGIIGRFKDTFTRKQLSEEKFEELFWEMELAMLENNVAVEVIEKIKGDLRDELTAGKISRMGVEDMILNRLRQSIEELFVEEPFDLVQEIRKAEKPYNICVIGVNGSGKTTTLAKLVRLFQESGLSCVVAASDTFRAAAIDQLKEHTDRLGVKLISQGYNADPAAVAYDAIEHAKSKGIDIVLIDTAGRLHSNKNLMAELEKVVRVAKPNLKLFVGESITGNDCVEQAKTFDALVGIDAIILSKADIDEKGGAAISVSYVTGKPILYLGTGQRYEDLERFEKGKIIEAVGL